MFRRLFGPALVSSLVWLAPLPSRAANHIVQITNQNTFDPVEITIDVGDTVTFQKGTTDLPHNVQSDGWSEGCAIGPTCFRSGAATNGPFSLAVTFDQAGTFGYFCQPHVAFGMVGRVIAQETAPPTDAGAVRFTSANFNRAESIGVASIQVERTSGDDGAVGVSFTTSNGSAIAGQDYATANGMLAWGDGEDGVKTFNLTITNDDVDETNETVSLHLTAPTGGATLGSPADATLTIVDDDSAGATGTLGFTSASWSVGESQAQATITVGRTGGSDGVASVDYDTANGSATAGQDYTAVGGTLHWAHGDATAKTFQIPILDDIDTEGSETLSVALSQPVGATLGSPASAAVTILDNEEVPPCTDGELQVCLLGRFLARIHWERPNNQGAGEGRVTKLTDSAAAFEFFEPGNVEVVLKMKDACAFPAGNPLRNFWPFVAGLTNVRVELTIIDTESGLERRFYNALGQPFFTPAADSPDGRSNPPGAIQATTEALGAFPTCDE